MWWKSTDSDKDREIKQLRSQNCELESSIELYERIRLVSEMQREYALAQQKVEEGLHHQLLDGAVTICKIRDSVAQSFHKLEDESQNLQESISSFEQIHELVSNIADSLAEIKRKNNDAGESVISLSKSGEAIERFVTQIQNISDQTNLLALNAAIEAARAGDQGRGFAVVADEVRSLAQKSALASSEINQIVSTITERTGHTKVQIKESEDSANSLYKETGNVQAILSDITDVSKNMFEVIEGSTHLNFLQTVKLDHVTWKSEVYRCVWGLSDKPIEDFVDHHHCRLGEWYYRGKGLRFNQLQAFQELEKPHANVHNEGIRAMKASLSRDKKTTHLALSGMEEASNQVIDLLSQLEGVSQTS